MFHQIDDTIVAISSAAGVSGRGVIRLSGPRAVELGAGVFACAGTAGLRESGGHRRLFGRLRVAGSSLPAEAYVFRAPASYTRQDVVELHTVGSPPVLAMVLDQLLGAGARAAEAGEFTARAFFNGAIDLTRAEGVAAAVTAQSDAQLRASQYLLHGGLGRRVSAMRETLADLLALVEAEIDFVEESIGFVTVEDAVAKIEQVALEIRETLAASMSLERLEALPEVVLLGRPNAGKSTLFNRLTGTDRAIRSAVAGTTRDLLRAPVNLPGGEIVLIDSAGLGTESDADDTSTLVDRLAREATLRAIKTADLALLVIDISQAPGPARERAELVRPVPSERRMIVVGTKVDLIAPESRERAACDAATRIAGSGVDVVALSALTGEGVPALRKMLGQQLFSEVLHRGGESIGLTARQYQSARDAGTALQRALDLLRSAAALSACAELVAIELREAVSALSLLTGEVTSEDLLGRIFSRFCIGK